MVLVVALSSCGADPVVESDPTDAPPGADAPLADTPASEGDDPRERPPGGHPDLVASLRADLAAVRHPSDGGGRVWLEGSATTRHASVSETGRWRFAYEAGPDGIAVGGWLFFQVPPFWGWSAPQTFDPSGPGFTRVEGQADGVTLAVGAVDEGLLGIEIGGRALRAGERILIDYGAGAVGARADRFAERDSRFWFAVDGDGDGVRQFLTDSPAIDVRAVRATQLVLTLPSTARPGDSVSLVAALLDPVGNAGAPWVGELRFVDPPAGLGLPDRVAIDAADQGSVRVALTAAETGIVRLRAEAHGGRPDATGVPPEIDVLRAESNPLRIAGDRARVLWADLHGHSSYSDGTGLPEDYYRYARDVAGLDVAALTDHDHWGIPFLDARPDLWADIVAQARRFHAPERFVTLLGYEWTNWLHGHRHVLYFDAEGELISCLDPATDTPDELWEALRGQRAMTFAHHSAGAPVPTNWAYPPDPELEPLTEVSSVHGSSEALDSPGLIGRPLEGNFVRDVLDAGHRLGFVGSGDSHDGHPGLAHIASPFGGVAAIFSESLTRDGILEALRARRVYATSGPRIGLDVRFEGAPMGSVLAAPADGRAELTVEVTAVDTLERIDLVRSGAVERSVDTNERRDVGLRVGLEGLRSGEYLYVRVVQRDGAVAWSSPFFLE